MLQPDYTRLARLQDDVRRALKLLDESVQYAALLEVRRARVCVDDARAVLESALWCSDMRSAA